MKTLKRTTTTFAIISFLLNFVNFGVNYFEGFNGQKGEYDFYISSILSVFFTENKISWLSVEIIENITTLLFYISTIVLFLIARFNYTKKLLLIPTIFFIIIALNNFLVIYFIGLETNFKMIGNLSFEHYAHLIINITLLIFVTLFSYKKDTSCLIIVIPCIVYILFLTGYSGYYFLFEGTLRIATLMRWIFIYLTYILISFRKEENSIEKPIKS